MAQSQALPRRRVSGRDTAETSRPSTNQHTDWIAEQAQLYNVKQLARLTGLSEKAVQNLRLGKSAANSTTITAWCRADDRFRAAYFQYCGGILSGEPELEAALTTAFNAYMQRNGGAP